METLISEMPPRLQTAIISHHAARCIYQHMLDIKQLAVATVSCALHRPFNGGASGINKPGRDTS